MVSLKGQQPDWVSMVTTEPEVLPAPIPLRRIAKQFGVGTLAIYKWKTLGRRNPYTLDRVYADFTWLPSGEWGMTRDQFEEFMRKLNEKP